VKYTENINIKESREERNDAPDMLYIIYKYILVFNHFTDEITLIELQRDNELSNLHKIESLINQRNFANYNFFTEGEEFSTVSDIIALIVLSIVLVMFFVLFYHEIISVSFDTEFARTRRIPTQFIEYTMMLFIAVTIVLSIRLVGIVLLMSLITVPQMTANLLTVNYHKIISLSVLFSFIGCVLGLFLSYYLNVPSGAFIIFVLILMYFLFKGVKNLMLRTSNRAITESIKQ
jgi:ABC-type Fe3+-siderophore transport system permease subunit